MFIAECHDEQGRRLLGSDGSFIFRDLKTEAGVRKAVAGLKWHRSTYMIRLFSLPEEARLADSSDPRYTLLGEYFPSVRAWFEPGWSHQVLNLPSDKPQAPPKKPCRLLEL